MGNTVFFSQYQPDNNNNNNNNNNNINNNNNNNNKEINECLLENHLKLSDAQLLRLKILNDIPINFPKYTIILLYAPPEFNILNIAEFISNKVNLPIIDINLLFIRKYSDHEINYISSSSSSTTMIIDKQENNSQKSIFETRIMLPDCDNGFVVFNYPQTPLQLKHLKEFLPQAKLLPLFLDLDNEAMRTLRNKFDRWVHEPTERSYHVLSRPPESLAGKEFAPTSFNMIDNVTGESLVQLKNDTIEDYKMKILDYRKQETLMISCFDEDVYIIPSCYSKPELHRQVIKCLARAMTNQTTQSNDEFLTEHISNDITLRECSVENKRKFRRNKSLGQGQKSSSL